MEIIKQNIHKIFHVLKINSLQMCFIEFDDENVGFDSDEEKALKNVIFSCFLDSTQMFEILKSSL